MARKETIPDQLTLFAAPRTRGGDPPRLASIKKGLGGVLRDRAPLAGRCREKPAFGVLLGNPGTICPKSECKPGTRNWKFGTSRWPNWISRPRVSFRTRANGIVARPWPNEAGSILGLPRL